MRNIKKVVSVIMIIILLCGCGKSKNNIPTVDKIVTNNGESLNTDNTTSNTNMSTTSYVEISDADRGSAQLIEVLGSDDANRLGVRKSIVWVYDSLTKPPTEKQVNALNELLVNEYDCDFVVEFHKYPTQVNSSYQYNEILYDMMKLKQRADLIFCGTQNWYTEMTEAGLYEPLTAMLEAEGGQKLWQIYPEEIWKMATREDNIYAVLSANEPSYRFILGCNKVMKEKYGITLPQEYSFNDLGQILEQLIKTSNSTNIFEEITPIVADYNALIYMMGYYFEGSLGGGMGNGILFKKDDFGSWMAVNAAKEEKIIGLMKQIKEYTNKGWYKSTLNLSNAEKREGSFLFYIDYKKGINHVGEKTLFHVSERSKSEFVTHEFIIEDVVFHTYSEIDNMMTGIASWSEYKEEAFKFLTLLHTEEKLSNLMYFGVEDEDWSYDGEANEIKLLQSDKIWCNFVYFTPFSNINLIPTVYIDPDDKIEFAKEIAKEHEEGPFMQYDVDVSGYVSKMSEISLIYNEYMTVLMSGKCEDIDKTVAEMNVKLEAKGINEIIDDINRQMRGE